MQRTLRLAIAATALAFASMAQAQLTAALAPVPAPFANAENARDAWSGSGATSTLTLVVTNNSTTALHRVDIAMPNTGYVARSGSATGWTAAAFASRGSTPGYVRFTSTCTSAGLAAGASATLAISFTTPNVATAADTVTSTPFTPSGSNQTSSDTACSGAVTRASGTGPVVAVKALLVTGQVTSTTSFFAAPATVTTRWTVLNLASAAKNGIALNSVVTPAATSTTCTPTTLSLASGTSGTVTCTHVLSAGGSYKFAAAASSGTGSVSAVGAYAKPSGSSTTTTVQVGTPSVTWTQSTMVRNRHLPYTVAFTVANTSSFAVTRVVLSGATPAGLALTQVSLSAGSGLTYQGVQGTSLVFTGSLAAGTSATVTVQLSGTAPTTTTAYATIVTLTPATGAAVAFNGAVRMVVPLPDVSGLTLLSATSGQTLAWTNTSGSGSTHDGVVVFRTAAATVPPIPSDFVDYQASGTVVYADRAASTAATFADAVTGAYNYRVCNHDAYFVYSDCNVGFWNGAGYVDSATAPTGGWTHQLGGEDLALIGALSVGRAAIPTNRPDVAVLDLATGQRAVAPLALPAGSLPPANSPGTHLANGRWVAFIADQGGAITAVDLEAGTIYWRVAKANESFTAGVSGVTRASASAAFQASFPMDVLFLGSASTGNVLAIDASTGATLWTVNVGANVFALTIYDPATNYVYVPTSGAGIVALDLGAASPTVAARAAAAWTNPGGTYRQYCVRTPVATAMACVDTSGVLRVLDRTTGAVRTQLATGVSSPTMLSKVLNGTPGFVLGNSSQVLRVTGNATLTSLAAGGRWTPAGQRLSPVWVNSAAGWIMVSSSDLRLHKLSSETGLEISQSPAITARTANMLLGPPAYDSIRNQFIFGTSEGRVWAVPANF